MPRIDDYRQRASECLMLSEHSLVPRHKELFLRMAQTWLTLADQEADSASFLEGPFAEADKRSVG